MAGRGRRATRDSSGYACRRRGKPGDGRSGYGVERARPGPGRGGPDVPAGQAAAVGGRSPRRAVQLVPAVGGRRGVNRAGREPDYSRREPVYETGPTRANICLHRCQPLARLRFAWRAMARRLLRLPVALEGRSTANRPRVASLRSRCRGRRGAAWYLLVRRRLHRLELEKAPLTPLTRTR